MPNKEDAVERIHRYKSSTSIWNERLLNQPINKGTLFDHAGSYTLENKLRFVVIAMFKGAALNNTKA